MPARLRELIGGQDPEKSQRVIQAVMNMCKLDLAALERAYDGTPEKPRRRRAR